MKVGCFLLFVVISSVAFSQEVAVKEFNDQMQGRSTLEMKKKKSLLTFYDGGKPIRTDEFEQAFVDTTRIEYSESEMAVILYCREQYQGCFDRRIFRTKNHSRYSRLSLLVADKSEGVKLQGILETFLRELNNN
jgi:hypothetical protein